MYKKFYEKSQTEYFKFKGIDIGTVDYRLLNLPEKNTLTYMSGYLMKKCIEKHTCQICIDYAHSQKHLDHLYLLSFYKAYSTNDLLIQHLGI